MGYMLLLHINIVCYAQFASDVCGIGVSIQQPYRNTSEHVVDMNVTNVKRI